MYSVIQRLEEKRWKPALLQASSLSPFGPHFVRSKSLQAILSQA
jgi:hypothetical protein